MYVLKHGKRLTNCNGCGEITSSNNSPMIHTKLYYEVLKFYGLPKSLPNTHFCSDCMEKGIDRRLQFKDIRMCPWSTSFLEKNLDYFKSQMSEEDVDIFQKNLNVEMRFEKNMVKIDFGSGYNPKKGYKTCDFTFSPFLDYVTKNNKIFDRKGEIKLGSVDRIHCRNVLHHVPELKNLLINFYKYLKKKGQFEVIECRKENYKQNVLLDNIWYRYINTRQDISIFESYRDYEKIAKRIGFKVKSKKYKDEKEIIIFEKY